MSTNDRWSALSMKDKADLIKLMVENGVTSLDDMKLYYNGGNLFDEGGEKNTQKIEKKRAIINPARYKRPENSSLIQHLAYKIGSDPTVARRGSASIGDIVDSVLKDNTALDDNKYAFLFGTGDRYPEVKEPIQGFNYTNYLNKTYRKNKRDKIKNVYGIINPEGEYHIDENLEGLARVLAKHNYHFYDNADVLNEDNDVENSKYKYRDDVANFIHTLGLDENGNVVVHDSDVYDFNPKDYGYDYKDSAITSLLIKSEAAAMNAAGVPYIIRQENQPLIFDSWDRQGMNINYHLNDLTEEDIARITNTGYLEPAYITEEGQPFVKTEKTQKNKGRLKK